MWCAALCLAVAFQSNFYEQGLKALQEQRYQAAVENFTNAIAAEPKDYALHFNLALAYSMLNKDAEGIAEYKKVLDIKPDLYQGQLNIGILLLRQKRPAEAIPYFTSAAAQKPTEFRPNYYLAESLSETGDFAKAEASYLVALQIDPKSGACELGLGHALAKQDRLADADPHFRKAAEIDSKFRDGLLELASMYEARKQTAEALALYEQFPDNPGAQERVGALMIEQGKASDAVTHLETAVAKSPTVANRAALATAYMRNHQQDKALPLIQQLLREQPNDYELQMVYGRMLRDQRKFPEAAEQFFKGLQLKPDAPECWSEYAGVLVMMEDYPRALAALDKLATLHAEKPGHVYLRAIVLDKIKQKKPAIESYQRFLEMSKGQFPDEEFKARQRIRIIESELNHR